MKYSVKLPLLLLLSVVSIYSCKKGKREMSIRGQVRDVTTLGYIPNAAVYMQRVNSDCWTCNPTVFDVIYSGQDGKFSYSLVAEKGYIYSVAAEADDYFNNQSVGGVSVSEKNEKNINILLQPYAWMKVKIRDVAPMDTFTSVHLNGVSGSFYFTSNQPVDTFVVYPVYGNQNLQLVYVLNDNLNSTYSQYLKLLFCAAKDTTYFSITF